MVVNQYILTHLKETDLENAYEIVRWQSQYLRNKNIDQYKQPYPDKSELKKRQDNGFNYNLYDQSNNRIAVYVSLMPNYLPECWKEYIPIEKFVWLTSLFTSQEYKGMRLGYKLLNEVEKNFKSDNYKLILLDCNIEFGIFLIDYYKQINYKVLAEKVVEYPTNTFKAALMKKKL